MKSLEELKKEAYAKLGEDTKIKDLPKELFDGITGHFSDFAKYVDYCGYYTYKKDICIINYSIDVVIEDFPEETQRKIYKYILAN